MCYWQWYAQFLFIHNVFEYFMQTVITINMETVAA